MNRKNLPFVATFLTISTLPVTAQWLNVPAKGIPRTSDGKPNLFAPTPEKPDGKPDLSGVWQLPRNSFKYLQLEGPGVCHAKAGFESLSG